MLYAVCNPIAGNGKAKKTADKLKNILKDKGTDCAFLYTQRPGHGEALAREAALSGADTVLSVGGDGTALEVARGLMDTNCALGVIPAGTGNDFVKTLGVPKNPMEALSYVLSHAPQKTDVGEINGKLFLNEIGTGFDVTTLDNAEKAKKYVHGLLPYLYGVLKTLFHFRSVPIEYAVDGGNTVSAQAFVVAAANGGMIGGGIPIAPKARADDGLLDIVIVGEIKRSDLVKRLIGLMKGKILSFPETTYLRASSITFSSPNMRVNIDGEIVPMPSVSAKILPGRLMIRR